MTETPLTAESEALLAEVHGTQMALTVFPARLRAIEAAAARRALEGSGVVEVGGASLIASERRRQVEVEGYTPERDAGQARELTLAAISYLLSSVGMLAASGHYWPWSLEAYKPTGPERDRIRAGALVAAAIDAMHPAHRAALPRPEEPRVGRCAFVWKSGTPCGKPKRDSRHKHDSSCLTGGEGHITDMLCHPYTPEAR